MIYDLAGLVIVVCASLVVVAICKLYGSLFDLVEKLRSGDRGEL